LNIVVVYVLIRALSIREEKAARKRAGVVRRTQMLVQMLVQVLQQLLLVAIVAMLMAVVIAVVIVVMIVVVIMTKAATRKTARRGRSGAKKRRSDVANQGAADAAADATAVMTTRVRTAPAHLSTSVRGGDTARYVSHVECIAQLNCWLLQRRRSADAFQASAAPVEDAGKPQKKRRKVKEPRSEVKEDELGMRDVCLALPVQPCVCLCVCVQLLHDDRVDEILRFLSQQHPEILHEQLRYRTGTAHDTGCFIDSEVKAYTVAHRVVLEHWDIFFGEEMQRVRKVRTSATAAYGKLIIVALVRYMGVLGNESRLSLKYVICNVTE
jgi:hypothetical protein